VAGVLGAGVLIVAIVVVVVVVRTRGDQSIAQPDGPLPTTPSVAVEGKRAHYSEMAVMQAGQRRAAAILTPPDAAPGERLPVVVLLHGRGISAGTFAADAGWDDAVADHRFIAVFPQGVSDSWNAGGCCRPATTLGMDDLALLDVFVADVAARPDVDPARIFMAGDSNGGMMTYRYLCEHADRLAGAASVTGTNVSGCEPNAARRFLHVAAGADEVVPYDGGSSPASLVFADGPFPAVPASVEAVAVAAGCAEPPASTDDGGVHTRTWDACRGGAVVELVTIDGAEHTWPRGAPYDATTEVLRFFGLAT
jgi:polyhydroxybutyrate depolymerase